jgi:nitrate/nitrite-specific signal transduction histidine kinase
MFSKKTYNIKYNAKRRKSRYDAEFNETHELLASENTNVCLEYDTCKEAKNAYQQLFKYVKDARQPLRVSIHNKTNVVIRKESN